MANHAIITNSSILRHELLSGIRTGRFSKDMILINVNGIALIYVLFSRMHVIASYKIIRLAKAEVKRLSYGFLQYTLSCIKDLSGGNKTSYATYETRGIKIKLGKLITQELFNSKEFQN